MQGPNRTTGVYGYSMRNYAQQASLYPQQQQHPGSQCSSNAPSAKPVVSGKSFTIDALLAKPHHHDIIGNGRTSPTYCGVKYHHQPAAAAPLLPLPGQMAPLPPGIMPPYHHLYSPNMLQHPAAHNNTQPGYSVYCCSPFGYQSSCGGPFYTQDSLSKVSVHSFKAKGGKSKRMRTSFTNEQLSRLEKEFARQQYMVGSERFLLASALQLTEAQVKVWFQNRRIKWRKQSLEQQQAKLAKLGLAAPPKSPGSQGHGDEVDDDEFSDGSSDVDIDVSDGSIDHC